MKKIFVVSRRSRPKNFRKVWEELLDFQDHPGRITKFMVEYSPLEMNMVDDVRGVGVIKMMMVDDMGEGGVKND